MTNRLLSAGALVVCCLSLLIACAKDELDTVGNVAGIITDATTGRALAGVSVSLTPSGKSFTTSTDGRYTFADIDMGSYTVQATKQGYEHTQKTVEVRGGKTSTLDLQLTPSAPQLYLSATSLDFGSTATTLTLDIRNTGAAALTWQVSEDVAWLDCQPKSGTTGVGQQASVVVTVDRSHLSRGSYSQTIAVASNGGSQTVRVTMTVDEGLPIEVTPEALDFGSTTTALQVQLTNPDASRTLVAYTLTPSNDWIHPDKQRGQFTYAETITVAVDRASLAEGSYQGYVTVGVDGQEKQIPVTMTVVAESEPTVALTGIDDISASSAQLMGAVVAIGSSRITHHGFVWGTEPNPTTASTLRCDLGDVARPADYTYVATSLQPATTYYVRAYATNDVGTAYSAQQRFTTERAPGQPTVETGEVKAVTAASAEATGNLTDLGVSTGVTAYGHVWSTEPQPTIAAARTDLGARTSKGTFSSMLTGLEPHTIYYVRAYARNQYGVSYGDAVQFTTAYGDVELSTQAATGVTATSAMSGGTIVALGGNEVEESGVCWSTSPSPLRTGAHATATAVGNTFTVQLTALSENTTYHVRAYVVASTGKTYYGQDITFTTPFEVKPPSLSAVSLSALTHQSATIAATVSSDGHGTISQAGFVWATTAEPTLSDSHTSCGTARELTAKLTGLQPETTYYVRAFAINEMGTAYGPVLHFTTKATPATPNIEGEGYPDDQQWDKSNAARGVEATDYPDDQQWDSSTAARGVEADDYDTDQPWGTKGQ